jgi:hypothetical protein
MVRRLMAVESDLIFLPTRGLDLLEAEEASVEVADLVIVEVAEVSVEDVASVVIVEVAEASVEVVASVVIVEAGVASVEDVASVIVEAGVALTVQLLMKIKAISSPSRAKRPLSECAEPDC